jgi:hypothetical protein
MLKNRLRVFVNRVLTKIFGPKRDEVTGGWRKLHNGDGMGCVCNTSGEKRNALLVIRMKARGKKTTRKTKT